MQDLLADWLTGFTLGDIVLALTNDHHGSDQLRGSTGNDKFSAGLPAERIDFTPPGDQDQGDF
jgi:hypothetical protein